LVEGINHAHDQRRFRSDDGQLDAVLTGEIDQGRHILGPDTHVMDTRLEPGAGIARGNIDGGRGAGTRQLPGHGVFPAAGADDEYLHASLSIIVQCRKWRIPVNSMAISCSSAAAMTSSSRRDPPGWMMARTPTSAA